MIEPWFYPMACMLVVLFIQNQQIKDLKRDISMMRIRKFGNAPDEPREVIK